MSLILVDGSALIYRAYYAFAGRPLTGPDGRPTSVVFGFMNSLLRLIETRRPEQLAVVFDMKGKTFRHEIFPDYKATRKPMPEDMAEQLPALRRALDAWGVPVMEMQGFEADDLIVTMARESSPVADRVWIYTGDKDFMQCLDERIRMLKPGRRGDEVTEYGPAEVERDHLGLSPAALIDVFALAGDSSDNIPGAPGIGMKTALKAISAVGSLDALLADPEAAPLSPRQRAIILEHREQVLLSRRLFTIDDAVPMDVDWDALGTTLPTGDAVREVMRELGLRRIETLAEKVARQTGLPAGRPAPGFAPPPPGEPVDAEPEPGSAPVTSSAPANRDYRIIHEEKELRLYLESIPEGAPLAVDTETDALRVDTARLVGLSLAHAEGVAVYVPLLMREGGGDLFDPPRECDRLEALGPLLAPVLADPGRQKVGQNLKFDAWILARHGLPLGGPLFDTMLAAYVLDPSRDSLKLDELARDCLGETTMPYADLFAGGDRTKDILAVPLERLGPYAAEDADMALRLQRVFAAQLADEPDLERLLREVELPLLSVLLDMERRGIKVDTDFLGDLQVRFAGELDDLEKRIHEAAGGEFNVRSPQQLGEILFEKLKLKRVKKTATGWSTDVSVLEALRDAHPLPGLILEHRQLAKLQSTYVEALAALADPETQLVHTSFNQAVAATGRLSSSDPNLQNIPVRTEQGRLIRRAFVPRAPGRVFLSADYSQIELRLLAHLSGDPTLVDTFRAGGDVHRRTAALINGVDESAVTAEMRGRAKAVNFGVVYGQGARALAKQVGLGLREAQAFIDGYFQTYPGVLAYKESCLERARSEGGTETLLGRRRPLPDILSPNGRLRSAAERMAVNTPIQGTAADLIKLAMLAVARELAASGLRAEMLLQVHDELLLEVDVGDVEALGDLVRRCMEGVHDLAVPLVVDVHTGANWAEAHG